MLNMPPYRPAVTTAPWVDMAAELLDLNEHRVGSLLASGYHSYLRILHPGFTNHRGSREYIRWRTVAAECGQVADGLMDWDELLQRIPVGLFPGIEEPSMGQLPESEFRPLHAVLKGQTTETRGMFAIWTGYSGGDWPTELPTILASRPMYLLEAELVDATTPLTTDDHPRYANLWWSVDSSWMVATDLDLYSTYVGCSKACAEQILDSPYLEVYEVTLATMISAQMH